MAWYEKSFRRNLVDMHIDDWNDAFLSQFDPESYFACLQVAQIQSPMIYLQSHVGLCNWDTASGRTHRAFKGNNKIRDLIDLCHDHGMDVVAYYSLIYNNAAYQDHPDWRMLHLDGSPSRSDPGIDMARGGRYGLVCPNQSGYRDFLRLQFAEFCAAYRFEGLFLDMTFWPMVCACDACRTRYREETGAEIPTLVDWQDPAWLRFQTARQRWMGEFAAWCTAELKQIKPDLTIEHQFSTVCHPWEFGVDDSVNETNDYTGGDLYGGHLQQSYICKIYREATNHQPFEYMTSRCEPTLRVHTITKTLRDLSLHNFLTLAHHGAFLVIDAIDPVGTMNPALYERIGQVFAQSKDYEPFLTGEYVREAALIMSYDSKFSFPAVPADPDQAERSHPQLDAQLGMARVLKEMRLTYTVLPGNRLDRLTGIKLAFLTDAAWLRDDQIETLVDYVAAGGSLYLSGTTDQRLVERLLGLTRIGITRETDTYLAPTMAGASVFGDEFNAKYPVSFPGKQVLVDNPLGHAILATVVLPYTDPADRSIFASIHANPPGLPTDYPAAVIGEYGKGKVLWLSCALESCQQAPIRDMMTRLVQLLAVPGIIASDAPACVELTLFRDSSHYVLHAVNVQNQDHALPVGPFMVTLKLPETITAVKRAPEQADVAAKIEANHVSLIIPALDLFETYLIEFVSDRSADALTKNEVSAQ